MKVHSTTGAISLHGSRSYDGATEDSMEGLEFYDAYVVTSYTVSSAWFGQDFLPFITVFRISDLVSISSHRLHFRMPWIGHQRNQIITDMYLIPHLYRVGNIIYMYGLTKNLYSSESSTRFPFVQSIDFSDYATDGFPNFGGAAARAA